MVHCRGVAEGYPLAQAVVYLLCNRKLANPLARISLSFVSVLAVLVILSPANTPELQIHHPSGDVIGWSWVRLTTTFINIYAAAFLVGGTVLSAVRFAKSTAPKELVLGNVSIAVGGILPGIGGTMAKAGYVEALYVAELVGLIFI